MHHVEATCIQSGVLALASYVVVDVLLLLLLWQMSQVGLLLFQLSVPLSTSPLQFTIWFDAVGVKVLLETVVLSYGFTVPSIGSVLKYNAVILSPLAAAGLFCKDSPAQRTQ